MLRIREVDVSGQAASADAVFPVQQARVFASSLDASPVPAQKLLRMLRASVLASASLKDPSMRQMCVRGAGSISLPLRSNFQSHNDPVNGRWSHSNSRDFGQKPDSVVAANLLALLQAIHEVAHSAPVGAFQSTMMSVLVQM